SQGLSSNSLSLLKLLSEIQKPDIELEEIEKLISQNVSLSYKLFRCVNSATFAIKNKMTSVNQAVVYLGIQRLKNWISLLAMSGNSNKPSELIQVGLVRAKMCELIAIERNFPDKDSYFIVGLFSILDAILDQPLDKILQKMPLDDDLNSALLEREGDKGKALWCSICCEQCIWDGIDYPDINQDRIYYLYHEAMNWSRQSIAEFN
ncbi:MAG: HDOD domain-containing protein, partial [Pseudomonadota bacterium]